jgi:hypothetical protein
LLLKEAERKTLMKILECMLHQHIHLTGPWMKEAWITAHATHDLICGHLDGHLDGPLKPPAVENRHMNACPIE